MAYSYDQYIANGGVGPYAVTFDFITKEHVKVRIGGALKAEGVDYVWPTSSSVQFLATVATGQLIDIRRESSRDERVVDFQDASVLGESELDADGNQAFYLAQEAFDRSDSAMHQDIADNKWDAGGNSIKDLPAPVNDSDAATKAYADGVRVVVTGAAASAQASATAASSSATAAAGSAASAATAQSGAATSAVSAASAAASSVAAAGLSVFVALHATAGTGTWADPWTGWDTNIVWDVNKTYFFANGVFAFTNTLNIHKAGIRLSGQSYRGTVLWHRGVGPALVNDSGDTSSLTADSFGFSMSDMRIWGNWNAGTGTGTTDGLYIRGHGSYSLVRCGAHNLSGASLRTGFTVQGYIEQWKCTVNDSWSLADTPGIDKYPAYGMYFDGNVAFGGSMSLTIVDPAITSCTQWGIYGLMLQNTKIIGGASEGSALGSVYLGPSSAGVKLDNFYASGNVDVNGTDHILSGMVGGGIVTLRGFHCKVIFGVFADINIEATARATTLVSPTIGYGSGPGAISDLSPAGQTVIIDPIEWDSSAPSRQGSKLVGSYDLRGALTVHPDSTATGKLQMGEVPFDGTWFGMNLNGAALAFSSVNIYGSTGTNKSLYLGRPTGNDINFTENNSVQITLQTGGNVFVANSAAVPSVNPTGGGVFYVQAGALKYRGSSGTVTTIAPA